MTKHPFITVLRWLAATVLLVGGVMAVRCFCVASFRVLTDSMETTLKRGDYILVNKLPIVGNPARGRVVLFSSPLPKDAASCPLFLSRCVGMPGDTVRITDDGYKIVVPRKGRAYRLDSLSLVVCREAIRAEAGDKAVFRDGRLFLDGRETSFFFFDRDYYWMLSDNADDAVDSRHLGLIPRSHIIGNAVLCWMSTDRRRIFKLIH